MATFKHPFEGETMNKVYDNIMTKDYKSLPASYSSNLSAFIGSLLRKNAKNRPSIEDLLFYDDTIVKAGITLMESDTYKRLIAAKKRIINDIDWFKTIKNPKMLSTYMTTFTSMYKAASVNPKMAHSTAELQPLKPTIKADDIIEYGEPEFEYKAKAEGSETGDLRKRLEANRLRINENQLNQAKVARITKKTTEEKKAEVTKKQIDGHSKESPVKFLKDYDLDNHYKTTKPQENLPKVKSKRNLPKIPNLELSED